MLILHNLRKEAKKSRYNLELFTQFYGEAYQNQVKLIKAIQTVLGNIQDCFILNEFLTNVFSVELAEKMPTLSKNIRKVRYEKWQGWEGLQRQFLDVKTRKELHLTILNTAQCESPI